MASSINNQRLSFTKSQHYNINSLDNKPELATALQTDKCCVNKADSSKKVCALQLLLVFFYSDYYKTT